MIFTVSGEGSLCCYLLRASIKLRFSRFASLRGAELALSREKSASPPSLFQEKNSQRTHAARFLRGGRDSGGRCSEAAEPQAEADAESESQLQKLSKFVVRTPIGR